MKTVGSFKMKLGAERRSNMPGCKGKIQYADEDKARKGLAKYKLSFPDDNNVIFYPCQTCKEYHIGHPAPDAEELDVEKKGRFIEHEGLLFAKILDPKLPYTYWVFVVPKGTLMDEADVMDKGRLVAVKKNGDIWRGKDNSRSEYHQVFFLIPPMNYAGALMDWHQRIERHKENMGDLMQIKMDLLNGCPGALAVPARVIKPVEEPVTADQKAKLISGQEMHGGRAVFRTEGGKPYYRQFHKCATEGCKHEIEMRAYIWQDKEGKLTSAQKFRPVDPLVSVRMGLTRKDSKVTCGACMRKVLDMPKEEIPVVPQAEDQPIIVAAEAAPTFEDLLENPPPPNEALVKEMERRKKVLVVDQERRRKETTVTNMQSTALNQNLTPEFVRGATIMGCYLMQPSALPFQL